MGPNDGHDPLPRDAAEETPGTAAERDRPELPDPATVVSEETFISPKGRRYRILKTRQTDPSDVSSDEEEPEP